MSCVVSDFFCGRFQHQQDCEQWCGALSTEKVLRRCSGGFYARNDGKNWIGTMLATATLFPMACFGIAAALNTIAIAYHSLAAVPFGSIMVVLLIWMFISFPLCLLGTVRPMNVGF